MGKAYGFFEIPSVTAAVVAIDIMCKTAEVELVTWEKKLGGRLVTIADDWSRSSSAAEYPLSVRPLKLPRRMGSKSLSARL